MSKFLSLLLRHRPDEVDLTLEPGGWVVVEELVRRARRQAGAPLDRERLERLVRNQAKPRFRLSDDGERIRANYGHSVDVDLDLEPSEPPDTLYHGTAASSVAAILSEGLTPRSRRFVHLSGDRASAREVGARHGRPVVLEIDAGAMDEGGHVLYRAARGIWLTLRVPPDFLRRLDP